MRPLLLRPPFFFSGASRLFSGSDVVMSSKAETERWRWPGVVGLSLRTARVRVVWAYVPRPRAGFAPGVLNQTLSKKSISPAESVTMAFL